MLWTSARLHVSEPAFVSPSDDLQGSRIPLTSPFSSMSNARDICSSSYSNVFMATPCPVL